MTTTTPTPTLPADWAPTSPGCLRTGDFWIWEYDDAAKNARTALGGPSQTTNCFASTFNPTITYAGSGCPPYYTSACQNSDFNAVTCCPSAYHFSCYSNYPAGISAEWFRCVSQYASQDVAVITRTDFTHNTIAVETRTRHKYEHLFALALMYTTPPSTIPSPSATSTSSLTNPSAGPFTSETASPVEASPGLTSGAAAGIGVGLTAAVFLLGFLIWFIYRRRKAAKSPPILPAQHMPTTPITPMTPMTYVSGGFRSASQHPSELTATPEPKELPNPEQLPAYELESNSAVAR
ncbi:hypothetical protein F5Y19DRAFT_409365 [Xylariaceae sp. FL1651]|nr:hypothetical protein F5Y19DRAFT_409365 [Xylariaceae sp. FL1651]